ncbi:phosphate signaling complex protein PhoU [Halobacillus sp. Marseille-Q1614]|uniref:phosphate signaling complex protein PhoU n=1 Tax=Halobacillus sp. Marseille-Q1614 TaxID=2709134 RepID=UPI0015711DB0|nr:phosphate signaling complex protein PhoU [Halobacillus sp. Marseille-Q1614]
MQTRRFFVEELEKLKVEVEELAEDTKQVLRNSVDALYNSDLKVAQSIIDNDHVYNKKEQHINESALIMIAKQQPVASDLRRLIVAIKISTDLERMADHGKNIAKATLFLGENPPISIHSSIREMMNLSLEMVDTAINAYHLEDVSFAMLLSEKDDKVDELYGRITKDLLEMTASNPDQIQYIMQTAYTSRYIERFADHITNIGESILYLIKGVSYDLND